MPEETSNHDKAVPEPASPLPEPPSFSPDPELIGYVERGQKPDVEKRITPPAEERQEQPSREE